MKVNIHISNDRALPPPRGQLDALQSEFNEATHSDIIRQKLTFDLKESIKITLSLTDASNHLCYNVSVSMVPPEKQKSQLQQPLLRNAANVECSC